jgi:hypothetical protein
MHIRFENVATETWRHFLHMAYLGDTLDGLDGGKTQTKHFNGGITLSTNDSGWNALSSNKRHSLRKQNFWG